MKILVITGSYPPDICGVGDYTSCLIGAADEKTWHLYYSNKWALFGICKKIKEIDSFKCSKIILQYPTQGYGWSLVPQLLCLYYTWFTNKTFIVVLHEFSQRTLKAKLATFPLLFANKVIFTNDFERKYAEIRFPLWKKRYNTIRILSNIRPSELLKGWDERNYDIVYFGHIRPLKGLEDFFYTIKVMAKKRSVKVAVIGQVVPEYESYITNLRQEYADLQIDYLFNNDADKVSALLNDSKIVFLPFPDGISERRGSFLAAIANGVLAMTYRGPFVTSHLEQLCFFTSYQEASEDIMWLLDKCPISVYKEKQKLMKQYLTQDLPASWAEIAHLYYKVCME